MIYLVFNEGYSASSGTTLIRSELTAEAIRLGRLLVALLPGEAEVIGLLALMLLQDSRRAARMTEAGDLILLDEQGRTLWDRAQIDEGVQWAQLALGMPALGVPAVQAAIAAVHAEHPMQDERIGRRSLDCAMCIANLSVSSR